MKINTISAYVLVYLLAHGHWNLMVPVRADVEGDGSSGMSSADAGLTAGGEADGSTPAAPAAPEGSSTSPDAGSTAGDGSGHVAGGSDADGTAGSSADGGSSGHASTVPDEHASVVELFTGGWTVDADSISNPELVAKKESAKRLADDARKAAQELLKKADELDKVIKDTGDLEEFNDKVDTIAYNLSVEASHLKSAAKPSDMMYYSGFPDGHHRYDEGAEEQLTEREKKVGDYMLYYDGFPNGWHSRGLEAIEQLSEREKKIEDYMLYYDGFPNGWHMRADHGLLREFRRHELKGEIEAKKEEIDRVKKQIDDLTEVYNALDSEIKKLEAEHKELENKLLGLDASLIKLYKADADGNPVEMVEITDFDKKKSQGDLRFVIKDGVICTEVKFGAAQVWKKGEHDVQEPKLVAFNDTVNVLAVRDENRAVLFKKETNSDAWYYHNTIERKRTGTATSRTAAQTGSSAGSTLASSSALAGSKMNLEAGSTGTPETPESLDETASVASGGSETNEASSTALRGSTSSAGEGLSSHGTAGHGLSSGEYSSVFMD